MRLKYIRLAGFKSFVDNTKVAFPEQMTCIVGPNGCGKSNVIDAVRWVLGESSAKNLRGDAMTDVIFNGSTARKPVSQASVELVFDNTEGRLQGEFAAYNEISVRRLVTRDGQSAYFLNGLKCRRRDITDLLLGTGLGPRSYAIIEQGMISRLIESRPQELRIFIEEAAGISKYKERRKETESRINRTRENLERLTDVREELGQQLQRLQRQAAAAKRYQSLKADERRLKSELQAIRWLHYQQQCDRVAGVLTEQETELEKRLAEQRGGERGQTELREQEYAGQEAVEKAQQAFYQAAARVARLEQDIRHQRQLEQQNQQQKEQLQLKLQRIQNEMCGEQERFSEYQAEQEELAFLLFGLEEEAEQAKNLQQQAEQDVQAWQQEWQGLRDQAAQLAEQNSVLQAEQSAWQQLSAEIKLRREQVDSELHSLASHDESELEAYRLALLEQEQHLAVAKEGYLALQQQQKKIQTDQAVSQEKMQQLNAQQHKVEGQLSSVQHLLAGQTPQSSEAFSIWLQQQTQLGSLSELLEVPETWLAATETLLQPWLAAPVLSQEPAEWPAGADRAVLVYGGEKHWPAASLAAHLGGIGRHLSLFDGIAAAATERQARQLLSQGQWLAVALPDGRLIGQDWLLARPSHADSQLVWQQEITGLTQKLAELQATGLQQKELLVSQTAALTAIKQELEHSQQQYQEAEQERIRIQERLRSAEQVWHGLQGRERALRQEQEQLEQRWLALTQQGQQYQQQQKNIAAAEAKLTPRLAASQEQGQQQQEQFRLAQHAAQDYQQQVHRSQLAKQQVDHQLQYMQQQRQRLAEQQEQLQVELQASEQAFTAAEEIALYEEELAEAIVQHELCEDELRQVREELSAVQQQLGLIQQGQSAVLEQIAQQRERVEASRLELAAARERGHALLEGFSEWGVALKEVLSKLPDDATEQVWQRELDDCLRKIAQLGAINLTAIEEVTAQAERKEYLDTQHEDLQASLFTLEEAIKKIDRETRQRFKQTFDQVNADLQRLFPKVFSGGTAYLELTDENLLETGVSIMARPPGKKNSTIHLLSGGEKALTALALVFAIFRLNPAPFCLLDEVDAPLDDINVGRFCRLVQEMSESVQFIYISHNKIAMEMATHLVGVTMQEPGVSRLVAVDVDEALAIADVS